MWSLLRSVRRAAACAADSSNASVVAVSAGDGEASATAECMPRLDDCWPCCSSKVCTTMASCSAADTVYSSSDSRSNCEANDCDRRSWCCGCWLNSHCTPPIALRIELLMDPLRSGKLSAVCACIPGDAMPLPRVLADPCPLGGLSCRARSPTTRAEIACSDMACSAVVLRRQLQNSHGKRSVVVLLSYNSLRLLLSGLCKRHTEGVCGLLSIAEAPVSLQKVVIDLCTSKLAHNCQRRIMATAAAHFFD